MNSTEQRDIQIRKEHELGMSNYRIAEQWGLTEESVARVLARG